VQCSVCFRGCPTCHEAAAAGGSPGGVMDWGFPSNLPESRLLRLLLLLLILVMAGTWLVGFVQRHVIISAVELCNSQLFYLKLSSTLGLLEPHRKHITSPLRAQQVNAIYRLVTMVYEYNYHNSGHYPSSCLLFKTQFNSIGLSVPHRKHTRLPYEPYRLMLSIGL
jgi:hypothetical protein